MTNYLVRFRTYQKIKGACNGNLISRGVQEHGTKIIYPLHFTSFDALPYNDKAEAETAREEMICTILYLGKSDNTCFDDVRKRINNEYVLNKAEYPSTFTAVQSLLINCQPNYDSNRQSQYQTFGNQLMFTQIGKTVDDEGEKKRIKQIPKQPWSHHLKWLHRKMSRCRNEWILYTEKSQRGFIRIQKYKVRKIWEQPPLVRRKTKT